MINKIDIIDDLSSISSIPKSTLDKLVEKTIDCICYAVKEAQLDTHSLNNDYLDDYTCKINIGIGELFIYVKEGVEVRYNFVPDDDLDNGIKETLSSNYPIIITKLEDSIINKIVNAYKDLI